MKRRRLPPIPCSPADVRWLKANLTSILRTLDAYQRALDAYFSRDDRWAVKARPVHSHREPVRSGMGHWMHYSADELAFIKRRRRLPRRALHAKFIAAFPRSDVNVDAIKALCSRKGWNTGRDGCFPKGHVPANKGKTMPFNANSARTQFKKGGLPPNTKYLGHERVSKDGYVEISVNQTNPHTGYERRYVLKHRWLWEQLHGTVPEGMALKCKGDKLNTDPSNWELVPRALLPRLNGKSGRGYDQAPDDLKPTIMAVAKLEHRVRENARAKQEAA